jgi:hypothetical protein
VKLTINTYHGPDLEIDALDDLTEDEARSAVRLAARDHGGVFGWSAPRGHLWPEQRPATCPSDLRDADGWATTGRILVGPGRQDVRAQAGSWHRPVLPPDCSSLRKWAELVHSEALASPKAPRPGTGLPPIGTYTEAPDAIDLQAAHDALAGLRVIKHDQYLIGVDEAGEMQAIVAVFINYGERWTCVAGGPS